MRQLLNQISHLQLNAVSRAVLRFPTGNMSALDTHVAPVLLTFRMDQRACQIFYQLKGGTVCYGEEHARCHGHACHGEAREGVFPEWDEDNPVHLIGHSYGGQTARVLQHLVSTGMMRCVASKHVSFEASEHRIFLCPSRRRGTVGECSASQISKAILAIAFFVGCPRATFEEPQMTV